LTGNSFGSNDILNGGGGNDTLFVQLGAAGVAGPATLTDIEAVSANFSIAGATLTLLGATGVTSIETNGSSFAAEFSNIGSTTPMLKVSNSNTNTTFGFTTAAVAGTADAVKLSVSGAAAGTIKIDGVESIDITSSGAPNSLTGLTATSATKIMVGGDQAINFTAGVGGVITPLSSTVTMLDASANTASGAGVTATFGAALTATVTGGSGNDAIAVSNVLGSVSVAGGAGNDTITIENTLTTADSIDGGAGTGDVLATSPANAEAYNAPTTRTLVGFEQLSLMTQATNGASLVPLGLGADIARVNLVGGTGGAYTITGPASAFTVTTKGTLGGELTVKDTGTATTDALTVQNALASTVAQANLLNGVNLVSTGYETVTLNTGGVGTAGAVGQTIGTVTITPDTGLVSGALSVKGSNGLTMGATNAGTIDASGLVGTAGLTMTAAPTLATGATGTTITGSGIGSTDWLSRQRLDRRWRRCRHDYSRYW